MSKLLNVEYAPLVERVVRNDEIFCSLLFDHKNRTLRVVDFRGGNFQSKHEYLERVLMQEGMRKIFTLIERDDINGWQRVGYHREGAIPGYYKRSDAYVMSRIYDGEFDPKEPQGEDVPANKDLLNDIKIIGKKLSETKDPSISVTQLSDAEAYEVVREALAERAENEKAAKAAKAKKGQKAATPAKAKKQKAAVPAEDSGTKPNGLLFPQFSREVEYYHFAIENRRTKQKNVVSTEYQDCFGNAKVHFCLPPESKQEQLLAKAGLSQVIDLLLEMGAVSIFSTADVKSSEINGVYTAVGFRNTGWMNRQIMLPGGPEDVILWTKKLI